MVIRSELHDLDIQIMRFISFFHSFNMLLQNKQYVLLSYHKLDKPHQREHLYQYNVMLQLCLL